MKKTLMTLSAKLLELHKELLTFQTQLVEEEDNQKYNSMDLWKLATSDPRFNWLRELSALIIQIDIAVSEKDESKAPTPESLIKKAEDLLSAQDSNFALNYQMALHTNPYLTIYDVEIRKMLKHQ